MKYSIKKYCKRTSVYLAGLLAFGLLAGCTKENGSGVIAQADGIVFSPVTAYQESLPGQVVSFKMRVKAPQPLTGFSIRFRLPGTTDFVALPEYPDVTTNANTVFSRFTTFEYSLPPVATATDTDMKFKFIATTAAATYEKEYTVRMLGAGLQQVRLYNPVAASFSTFSAIDLLQSRGVPADAPSSTKDLTAFTIQSSSIDNGNFTLLSGWQSDNGTKFKLITDANYASSPTQYASIYAGIAAVNEISGTANNLAAILAGKGPLTVSKPYIAKVNRNGVFSYVAFLVKKLPNNTVTEVNGVSTLDLTNEYIQLEIKK
jgi:hypothetical protein